MKRIALAVLLMPTIGCATVLGSKQHDFMFDTAPEQAQVSVDGNPVGTTPVTVNLSNTKAHTVTFKKVGYADIGCVLEKGTGAGWVILDVVFGVVPIVIDAATGNWSQTKEHACRQILTPVAATGPSHG